ncbi:MAG: cephalosporin hydroxylase family protein [Woronichinia naegeliana WA131]|uniref:Cephalosporin hydroxylase family protein n=1 Tax=Woronichinia naegeliana WA131 TaxID=2824559 RepID=A0A977KW46_9CYAN|nr:MAG: cephalosporin hydroxylase family protein [Woronichinia naegeliana WA131]
MSKPKNNFIKEFLTEKEARIASYANDTDWHNLSLKWLVRAFEQKYMYNFSVLGRPVIQTPFEMVAMQEIIWSVQPDLIIETGIAHGGSLVFSSSMLELNAICGGPQEAEVLGIDIDIRKHNREAIEAHPMFKRISMIQGSSIAPEIIEQVTAKAEGKQKILVLLDSNHTHDHVLAELEAYAPLTSIGSYCVVFDTVVEDLPDEMFNDRPWGVGNNPKTAVWEYLKTHPEFEIDKSVQNKLLITVAPDGYLKRVK